MNILCKILGHRLLVEVDDYDVVDGKLIYKSRNHYMCQSCYAVNWQEEHYPSPGMWFDKSIK